MTTYAETLPRKIRRRSGGTFSRTTRPVGRLRGSRRTRRVLPIVPMLLPFSPRTFRRRLPWSDRAWADYYS